MDEILFRGKLVNNGAMVCTKKQMMDIGGMETIFVVMGESRGKYIEN